MLPAAISFSELLNSHYPNTQQQKQCNGVMDLDELSKSEHSLKFPTGPPGDDSAMTSGYIAAYILCVCVIQLASIFTSSLLTIMVALSKLPVVAVYTVTRSVVLINFRYLVCFRPCISQCTGLIE